MSFWTVILPVGGVAFFSNSTTLLSHECPFFACCFAGNALFCKVQILASYFMIFICAVCYFSLSVEFYMYQYFLVDLCI